MSNWHAPIASKSNPGMYQLPDAPGHYSYRSKKNQWAAEPMMLFLIELSCAWMLNNITRRPPIPIGDISTESGKIPGGPTSHTTHKRGQRVDIGIILKDINYRRSDSAKGEPSYKDKERYDFQGTKELIRIIRFICDRRFSASKPRFRKSDMRYQTVEFHYNDKNTWSEWPIRITFHVNHDEHLHVSIGDWHPYSKADAKQILSQPVMKSLPFFLKDRWFKQQ